MQNYYKEPKNLARMNKQIREFWDSPRGLAERKRQSKIKKQYYKTPGARELTSRTTREAMLKPEFRAYFSEIHKKENLSLEALNNMKIANKKNWQNPQYREKVVESHVKYRVLCVETGEIFQSTFKASFKLFGKCTSSTKRKLYHSLNTGEGLKINGVEYHFKKIVKMETNTNKTPENEDN